MRHGSRLGAFAWRASQRRPDARLARSLLKSLCPDGAVLPWFTPRPSCRSAPGPNTAVACRRYTAGAACPAATVHETQLLDRRLRLRGIAYRRILSVD
jgi:hypothetical protein